jgi:hypothetical protein
VHIEAEQLIGPAIAVMYLKDGLLMLERDEAMLVRGWRGRWRASFGPRDLLLRGRAPWLCHPFKPMQPVLRLRWSAVPPAAPTPASAPADVPDALRALAPWVAAIWTLLFVGLPIAFYGHFALRVLLTLLGELYVVIAIALVLVYRRRDALGLTRRAFGVLAFELLACAPYAANLVRRLSLMRRVDEDLVVASERLLKDDALADMQAQCLRRIDDELEAIDADSPRARALLDARGRFDHGHQ